MKILFKITEPLLRKVHSDLARPHPFAAERVGFLACQVALMKPPALLILAREFWAVPMMIILMIPALAQRLMQRLSEDRFRKHIQRRRPCFTYMSTTILVVRGSVVLTYVRQRILCRTSGMCDPSSPTALWCSAGIQLRVSAGCLVRTSRSRFRVSWWLVIR